MAEIDLDPGSADSPQAGMVGTLLNWTGALVSLALIGGLTVWGYKMAVRDVSGVPVVRAIEGPMRIAPDDPGGELAAHQGLAVNAVAADGQAEDPADRLILAPRPLSLTDEDLAGAELSLASTAPERTPSPTPRPAPAGEEIALDEMVPEGVEELSAPLDAPEQAVAALETIPSSVPGVARSPRPAARPDLDFAAESVAAAVASSVAESLATRSGGVDPATLEPGTRLVQLGAFDSEAVALEEWARVQDRFGDYVGERKHLIEKAESGGKTFYRLRMVGFEDIADARRFCAALQSQNANCIPVVAR